MCNSISCGDDESLDDGLDGLFADFGRETPAVLPSAPIDWQAAVEAASAAVYSEPCKKCRGSGRFRSYTGRDCGPCFACKGAGEMTFRTSPEARAAGRESAARVAERKAAELAACADGWRAENPLEAEWIAARAPRFEFAASMRDALAKYGALTERQLAAVRRCLLADADRDAKREAERAQRAAGAPVADVAALESAFARAAAAGVKSPKLRIGAFTFKPAKATSSNAGALYVTRRADSEYLGKVAGGRFLAVRACSADESAAIVAACADPRSAAIAHGRQFGECSVCGRELSDPESIARAIGPVCAEKWGF